MEQTGESFFRKKQSMLGAWQEADSNRAPQAAQGYAPQPPDVDSHPLGAQPFPESQVNTNQMLYNIYYPALDTSHPYRSSPLTTSSSDFLDSTYETGTGSYTRQLSSTNDTTWSDVTTNTHDRTQFTKYPDLFDWNAIWPLHPTNTQVLTEPAHDFTGSMRVQPQWTPSEAVVPEKVRENKKHRLSFNSDIAIEERPAKKRTEQSPSSLVGATSKQEAELEHRLFEWEKRSHLPSEKEVRAIATLAGLSFLKVALWYGDRLRLQPPDAPSLDHSSTDQSVMQDVSDYIEDAGAKTCRSTHSEKAEGGKYVCTLGCGYSTNQRDAWIRHEEKRQPQKFWHCIICRAEQKNCIVHRPDKFREHANKCHPSEDVEELRERSRVPYDAPFIKSCNFILNEASGLKCNYVFTNWKERNHHYFQHFEDRQHGHSPQGPDDDGSSDDDDNDDGGGSGSGNDSHEEEEDGSGNSPGASNHASLPNSFFGAYQYHHSHNPTANVHYQREGPYCPNGMSTLADNILHSAYKSGYVTEHIESCMTPVPGENPARTLAAHYLIHVETIQPMEADVGLRYLALKYSASQSASTRCLESSQKLSRPMLPSLKDFPAVFRKAFELAKVMGFEFVWIDILCGLRKDTGGIDAVYQQASLILVIGHPSQCTDQISHFTCDYAHLGMVQSWANQSVSFRSLQQLGHGAYGVVDKVELRPSNKTYARKTIFCTGQERISTAQYIQEIEVMRKLQHPHIAHFIAAYFDHGAFNILMSPVADCDLRRYLACPEDFPDKRQHLLSWFLSLAEALAYIHEQNCRHKDIKPANILISGHNILLTDFGTSLDFSANQSQSIGGCLMTPKYCAPEVAAHGSRGRSADVFSLGCVFAEMITVEAGKSLDEMNQYLNIQKETDRRATYHGHLQQLLAWLGRLFRTCLSGVRKKILGIGMKMLDRNPARRPSALDVGKVLCPRAYFDDLQKGSQCRCCLVEPQTNSVNPNADEQRERSSHPSFQAQSSTMLSLTHSGSAPKYVASSSYPAIGSSTDWVNPRKTAMLLIDCDLPDYSRLLSLEKMRYWQELLTALLNQVLDLWLQKLDARPFGTCACPSKRAEHQTFNSINPMANDSKIAARRCRSASLESGRLISHNIV